MIYTKEDERLLTLNSERMVGTDNINYRNLVESAHKRHNSLRDIRIDETFNAPLGVIYNPITQDISLKYAHPYLKDGSKEQKGYHTCDATEYAYKQTCNLLGIPSDYLDSLYTRGLTNLAADSVRSLSQDSRARGRFDGYRVLRYGDTVEAVVSKKFDNNFPTCDMLEVLEKTVDMEKYVPNQAFISNSRFHIRMVDFDNPEYVNGDKVSVGFTVSNSDIGKAALRVQFFIYRFACKNGIVRISKGGTLYRQAHIGKAFDADAIEEFKAAFSDIEELRRTSLQQIADAQNRMMSIKEMRSLLENKSYGFTNDAIDNIIKITESKYWGTKWGLINGITENAKIYSLTDRLNHEAVAGNILARAM